MKTPRSSTKTLIRAMRILAHEIQSKDGVANMAILEASKRLEELSIENKAVKEFMAKLEKEKS